MHGEGGCQGSMKGWLEILDRTGKVAQRFPVGATSIRIGRAYDNDIVLDDPYVCPHHVALSWSGGRLHVVDLGSINGVLFGKQEQRSSAEVLDNDQRFRIGRTLLRFRSHDCPLPETWVDRPIHAPLRLVERPWVLAMLYLGVVLYRAVEFYLTSTSSLEHVRLVTEMVALVAVVIGWAALWSFPSRLLMGRWNFLIHCGIASFGLVAQAFTETLWSYLCFMADSDQALMVLTQISEWVLLAVVLYAHLTYLVAVPAARLMRWAGGVVISMAGLVLLVQHLEGQEFRASPDYEMTVKPPLFRMADGQSVQELEACLDGLRIEVDAQRDNKD